MHFYINEIKNVFLCRLLNDCFKIEYWFRYTSIYIVIVHFTFELSIPDNDNFILAKYSTIESCHEVVFGNKLILETNTKLMMWLAQMLMPPANFLKLD